MNTKPVVIIGGGIHGASIAYNLSLKGVKVVIIESTMIAAAASGKAGGFLARNMGYGITKELHEKSFDLHEQLAHTLSLKTYRKIPTIALDGSRNGKQKIASWLDRKVSSQLMSLEADTAQVTPKELTEAFVNHAVSHGAEVIIGKTEDIIKDGGKVTSVIVNGKEIQCSSLIVAMGIWSQPFLADNFNLHIPMEGIKSTSIIINDVKEIRDEPYACFCEEDVNHCHLELYPRSNGDLYICGLGGSDYVSGDRLRDGGDCASADMIKGDASRVGAALASLKGMTSIGDRGADVIQACMRPCTNDGLPVMGLLPDTDNCYVSTGHNCWGILWAPIAGVAMTELITTGTCSCIKLDNFSPNRYSQVSVNTNGTKNRERKD